jgi:protein-disulfide isomerase
MSSIARFAFIAAWLASPPILSWAQAQESPVVGRIDGEVVRERDLLNIFAAGFRTLATQESELKKRALEEVFARHLVQKEAARLGIKPEELLPREVDPTVPDPSQAELEAFYLGQRDRLNKPFADVRSQLFEALKQARVQQKRQEYLSRLRDAADVQVLLNPVRFQISNDFHRVRGDGSAPVTIVEFSDFQCPYCKQSAATLEAVLAKYQGSVRLAFRDFPMRTLHPNAQAAAEAARCADEQGKFWQYHDLLFADQSKLDKAGLLENARALKLDVQRFQTCVDKGTYRDKIDLDMQEGTRSSVTGTPAFFINGIFLSGTQTVATFGSLIEQELAAQGRSQPAAHR